ncbi:MAG TPA: serine/threonine-protein kinase [Gemmatimonadaceae bacterium]|nr:serine/threonine-protein kinase [Gemmatimonadaceae bacterium]
MLPISTTPIPAPVDEPRITQSDAELRSHIERVLAGVYELDREIGRGGMGIVYRARDKRLKRPVAIKLLPPELAFRSEIRSRFLREAETAAQLSHPCIVPIYSVDEKDGLVFFVMAFVDGENLARRIHETGPLDPDETRRILREVGDALAYAHERGVVHRDIKPDNIILDRQNGRPMVTDFGIARAVTEGGEARLTATGIAIGTPAFMSPEQSAGERELDGRSDLYSLGVVAYQMLCGDLPFTASNTPALLVKHLSERPVPIDQRRAEIPGDLARAVMLCLEKRPEDRFPSARALVTALDTGDVPSLPAPRPSTPVAAQSFYSDATLDPVGSYVPTRDDLARWNTPIVAAFRKTFAPFVFVGAAVTILAIFGIGPNFMGLWAMWAVYVAYRYAKLWSDGYDWHDVFRQRRDRLFMDVMGERVDDVQAIWSRKKRLEVRERQRARLLSPGLFTPVSSESARPSAISTAETAALGSGPHAQTARRAITDREEIRRLVDSLPKEERARIPDVVPTAQTLAQKVVGLAASLEELDRSAPPDSGASIEKEITLLESQANPLDRAASEERVRRLAFLKRQRRTVAELARRRDELSGRLESCALALHNMRLDVLRFKTGAAPWQHVTTVSEQAMALAREVDSAVYVADELSRLAKPTQPRRAAPGRP